MEAVWQQEGREGKLRKQNSQQEPQRSLCISVTLLLRSSVLSQIGLHCFQLINPKRYCQCCHGPTTYGKPEKTEPFGEHLLGTSSCAAKARRRLCGLFSVPQAQL
jgi:hypothetical protein